MAMQVWLNGQFVDRKDAQVSAFDAGLQHGIGLFETMAARNGTIFRAEAHTRRLVESARTLLLSDRLRAEPLAEAAEQTVTHNGLEDARVRLTVTGGNLNRLADPGGQMDPTVLIDVQPPTPYPETFFEQGVMVTIADGRLNTMLPMAGHKTLNYWPRIHALQRATVKRAGECLWFTIRAHLAGGSVSNVFLVKDGGLLTPFARGEDERDPTAPAVLPGITRASIIELCDARGYDLQRRSLKIDDLLSADEVFLTNSSWGVLPVVAVEKETIGDGAVGTITSRLRDSWLDVVERETTAGAAPEDRIDT